MPIVKAKEIVNPVLAWRITRAEPIPDWAKKDGRCYWNDDGDPKYFICGAPRVYGGWQTCEEGDYILFDEREDDKIWAEDKEYFELTYEILKD